MYEEEIKNTETKIKGEIEEANQKIEDFDMKGAYEIAILLLDENGHFIQITSTDLFGSCSVTLAYDKSANFRDVIQTKGE